MLQILSATNDTEWNAAQRDAAAARLPPADLARSRRYRRWQDGQATLLGRLLLRLVLTRRGLDPDLLGRIAIDAADRPSLPISLDFNISHTDGLVVLIAGDDGAVGIDVERLRPLDPDDLGTALTAADRRRIAAADDPAAAMLQCWTAKEAVVKAAGLGITVPELPLWHDDGPMTCDGRPWWLATWRLPGHILTAAHGRPFTPPAIEEIALETLLAQI